MVYAVYFADLVTKSANYCHASRENPVGVMLLSRVALGKTYDCTQAEFMNANKPGFDSTKGCGATGPDPAENVTMYAPPELMLMMKEMMPLTCCCGWAVGWRRADGTVVPLGKPVPTGTSNTSLLYNEFIVYDVAQLLIKYLVVVEFKYS
jgi:poly [ADP-ribose] polymerase